MPRLEGEKSKAPLWLIGVVVAVLAAGAVWYATRQSQDDNTDVVVNQTTVENSASNSAENSTDNAAANATTDGASANGVVVPTPVPPDQNAANATSATNSTTATNSASNSASGTTSNVPPGQPGAPGSPADNAASGAASNSTMPSSGGPSSTGGAATPLPNTMGNPGIQQPGISNAPTGSQSRVIQPGSPTVTFNQNGQPQTTGR